jgi:peptide/nickel transport system substrate-binding protein
MPQDNQVTADPAIRLALNQALDRKALLAGPLDGKGAPASTPVPDTLAEFTEPGAGFTADQLAAARTLETASWTLGTDGIRARGGVSARFTLRYPVGDSLARDLAVVFSQSARTVGVLVDTREAGATELPAAGEAVLTSVGDPFDPDLSLYPLLGDTPGETGAQVRIAHTATDPAQRAVAYRAMQRAYLAAPTMVVLANTEHSYVVRQNWNGYQAVTDAAGSGIAWGAWWNLQKWTPR